MITALIDVNPIMKGDPQGEVEVRAEAKEMEDIAKKIRSIE